MGQDTRPTREAVVRAMFFTSMVSPQRDPQTGLPVNAAGGLQPPPAGLPLVEAAFSLHLSMLLTLDGWGVAALCADKGAANWPLSQFLGPQGIKSQWNQNYGDLAQTCGQVATLPQIPAAIPHCEVYDVHIYIPHGRADLVRARYTQLTADHPGRRPNGSHWVTNGRRRTR